MSEPVKCRECNHFTPHKVQPGDWCEAARCLCHHFYPTQPPVEPGCGKAEGPIFKMSREQFQRPADFYMYQREVHAIFAQGQSASDKAHRERVAKLRAELEDSQQRADKASMSPDGSFFAGQHDAYREAIYYLDEIFSDPPGTLGG